MENENNYTGKELKIHRCAFGAETINSTLFYTKYGTFMSRQIIGSPFQYIGCLFGSIYENIVEIGPGHNSISQC
jgi:hypothetical protein